MNEGPKLGSGVHVRNDWLWVNSVERLDDLGQLQTPAPSELQVRYEPHDKGCNASKGQIEQRADDRRIAGHDLARPRICQRAKSCYEGCCRARYTYPVELDPARRHRNRLRVCDRILGEATPW